MLNWKKRLLIFICSLLPILVAAGWALVDQYRNNYILELKLSGPATVSLEYGQTYEEMGASAQCYGIFYDREKVNVPVTVEGIVKDDTLGTYTITYYAAYKNVSKRLTRVVQVQDTTAPVITLTASEETYTLPGQPYQEEGFIATDNFDGDVTAKVVRQEADGVVTYTVTDTSGNCSTISRHIRYDDPIPPILYLKGDASTAMTMGKAYQDPGFWATDNCDGDLTSKIQVSGYVDGNVPGTYTLQYYVEDSYGNVAAARRTVVVAEHPVQEYVENPEKIIYLTFDDGPGPYTEQLLDTLKAYNVKATFFVVNTAYINTITRAAAEGHTVAIHTATHRFKDIYASEDAYFADLNQMREIIREKTGKESNILRFPGGSSNTISSFNKGIMTRLTQLVTEAGFRYFDWNVDSKDAGGARTADEVFENVVAGIGEKKVCVILQHDIKDFSVDAVGRIITWALENGYTFLPLTEDSPACEHNIYN